MNIVNTLVQNTSRHPEKMALTFENRSYTYSEFNKLVNRFANGLLIQGVKKGEKIALMMKNSDSFAIAYYACAKIGAVIVPMNFRLVEREVSYILDQSDSVLVICDQEYEALVQEAKSGISHVRQVITVEKPTIIGNLSIEAVLSDKDDEPPIEIKNTDDLHILYTSGTTGNPKGAVFDHQRVTNVIVSLMGTLGYHSEEKFIHIAPLFHAAQLVICLTSSLFIGASNVIHREFNPTAIFRDIEKYKISTFFAVPTMYMFLLQFPDKDQYDVSSIKRFLYGAAPMSGDQVKACMSFFKSQNFYSLCGLTEAGPSGIYLSPEDHQTKVGSAGKNALFLNEVKLVAPNGQETKPGEVGELTFKGRTIMKEYYKKPKETAETIRDGWLHTGDLGIKDEDGYVYIVDRSKDMIITGGENVYSVEVENVLHSHPQIQDVAIIGSPDPEWGEVVTAVIVRKTGKTIDQTELEAFCRRHLSAYKIPRKVIFKDELPRNASGKLLKFRLRETINNVNPNYAAK
ncbi:long-chain-fatty-acid--CoA ligase [Neobacillus niacini]|uniref:long-chain-fatty-acid--CoA ligase n=1 Tax=Neobacillus niacini TaxID=86668 RepID=UPI00052FC1C2|nr:long-chain-fatty-acid--CoA ligase [Neobacillus niacini]KGM45098.1 long-chain fatty acid--CoA ligase [Neobacillus niacini]MEC1525181.1 long-chain-fatty-acid--CoA ligase [Neobacillus niacini]